MTKTNILFLAIGSFSTFLIAIITFYLFIERKEADTSILIRTTEFNIPSGTILTSKISDDFINDITNQIFDYRLKYLTRTKNKTLSKTDDPDFLSSNEERKNLAKSIVNQFMDGIDIDILSKIRNSNGLNTLFIQNNGNKIEENIDIYISDINFIHNKSQINSSIKNNGDIINIDILRPKEKIILYVWTDYAMIENYKHDSDNFRASSNAGEIDIDFDTYYSKTESYFSHPFFIIFLISLVWVFLTAMISSSFSNTATSDVATKQKAPVSKASRSAKKSPNSSKGGQKSRSDYGLEWKNRILARREGYFPSPSH